MNIAQIDKNFHVETKIQKDHIVFKNALEAPFSLHGVFFEDGLYRRMPESVAQSVSDSVYRLHAKTAGGRVRFVTDSAFVAVYVEVYRPGKMPHFALTGSIGLDLYADDVYYKTFVPPFDVTDVFESCADFTEKKRREICINMPLYTGVKALYIGLEEGSLLEAPTPYRSELPVVYYGSSITQGGCASRPGAAYQSIISRRLHCDHVNLGFSGSAKAEDEMIAYVSSLQMSAFVLDYDYNAPSDAHLAATHGKMFRAVRESHPELPILMLPRPRFTPTEESARRRDIIYKTYCEAIDSGDKNVYFLEGAELMALCGDEGTVDNCHPTDLGFFSMAKAVGDVLEKYVFPS